MGWDKPVAEPHESLYGVSFGDFYSSLTTLMTPSSLSNVHLSPFSVLLTVLNYILIVSIDIPLMS